jgi:hypothetical protein
MGTVEQMDQVLGDLVGFVAELLRAKAARTR